MKHAGSFSKGGQFGHIRSPTLNIRGDGSWGCLQMMTVTPMMSSSSSTATVVSMGSPENTCLGHWARIRLRMVSRRTAGVKVKENRLDSEVKDIRTLGHTPPQAAQIKKGIISLLLLNNNKQTNKQNKKTTHTHLHPILSISEYHQKRNPNAHQAGKHIHRQSG